MAGLKLCSSCLLSSWDYSYEPLVSSLTVWSLAGTVLLFSFVKWGLGTVSVSWGRCDNANNVPASPAPSAPSKVPAVIWGPFQ
jgi:hypothetical protein